MAQLKYNSNKTLLGSFSTAGGSYTATEDCVMYAYISGKSDNNTTPYLMIDGEIFILAHGYSGNGHRARIGMNSTSGSFPDIYSVGMYIPKGATISSRNASGQGYDVRFYTLD